MCFYYFFLQRILVLCNFSYFFYLFSTIQLSLSWFTLSYLLLCFIDLFMTLIYFGLPLSILLSSSILFSSLVPYFLWQPEFLPGAWWVHFSFLMNYLRSNISLARCMIPCSVPSLEYWWNFRIAAQLLASAALASSRLLSWYCLQIYSLPSPEPAYCRNLTVRCLRFLGSSLHWGICKEIACSKLLILWGKTSPFSLKQEYSPPPLDD